MVFEVKQQLVDLHEAQARRVLGVLRAGLEAAMQDADEAIAELTQYGAVSNAAATEWS